MIQFFLSLYHSFIGTTSKHLDLTREDFLALYPPSRVVRDDVESVGEPRPMAQPGLFIYKIDCSGPSTIVVEQTHLV